MMQNGRVGGASKLHLRHAKRMWIKGALGLADHAFRKNALTSILAGVGERGRGYELEGQGSVRK
jgi:hypothetical protein